MAEVRLTERAIKEMDALPLGIHTRLLKMLERLEQWPHISGAKPLRGPLAGRFRLRTGDYRLQFYVVDDMVFVEQIGHRDGFYES